MKNLSLMPLLLLTIIMSAFSAPDAPDTFIVSPKGDTLRGHVMEPMLSSFNRGPYTTFGSDAHTQVVVHWGTDGDQPSAVAYGTTPSMGDTAVLSGTREDHHVTLTGLEPGTTYYYSIIGEIYTGTFRTAPVEIENFSFAAFGDNRTNHDDHQSVVDAILGEGDIEFVLNVGDLVGDGGSTSDWQMFFEIECDLLANHVMMPAKGNHDVSYWPWDPDPMEKYFDFVEYGSFNYANVHVVWLCTEVGLFGSLDDQVTFLHSDLSAARANPTIDWIVVYFHHPPFSSGNHGDNSAPKESFVPVFKQYGVDVVFCGHDHHYERMHPIGGTTYIITGGGGAPLYSVTGGPVSAFAIRSLQFCKVSVSGPRLNIQSINPAGEVIDRITLHKGPQIQRPNIVVPHIVMPGENFAVQFKTFRNVEGNRYSIKNRFNGESNWLFTSTAVEDSVNHYTIDCWTNSWAEPGGYDLIIESPEGLADTAFNAVYVVEEFEDPFEFIHITDTHLGSTVEHLNNLIHGFDVSDMLNPAFILITGDICDAGYRQEYAEIFELINKMHVPVFAVPGNHDYEYWDGVDGYMDMLSPIRRYSFDYGDYHFVMMDTKHDNGFPFYQCYGFNADDLAWLQNDLVGHSDSRFTIIGFHGPIFDELTPNLHGRDTFVSLCMANNVKLTLAGHTHFNKIFDSSGNRLLFGSWQTAGWPLFIQTASVAKNETFTPRHDLRSIRIEDGEITKLTSDENGDGIIERETAWDILRFDMHDYISPDTMSAVFTITNNNYESFANCRKHTKMLAEVVYESDGGEIIDIERRGKHSLEFDSPARTVVVILLNAESLLAQENRHLAKDLSLNIYPNPFNSSCRIEAPSGAQIEIIDIAGRLVSRIDEDNRLWVPSKSLASGSYFVKITYGGESMTRKVILVK